MEKKVGDEITVKLVRFRTQIPVKGKIKDIRKRFGRKEFLISEAVAEDFWVRTYEE